MPRQPIPNSLRYYRIKAGLRQADVAARLGFTSNDRISHWEKGQMVPQLTNLFKLSVVYQTTPQDLFRELFDQIRTQLSQDATPVFPSLPTDPALHREEGRDQVVLPRPNDCGTGEALPHAQ